MNVEQHAEAILRAAFGVTDCENLHLDPIILRQSLTAVEAAMVAGASMGIAASLREAESYRDGWQDFMHRVPSDQCAYSCLKACANIVGSVRELDPAAIVKGISND